MPRNHLAPKRRLPWRPSQAVILPDVLVVAECTSRRPDGLPCPWITAPRPSLEAVKAAVAHREAHKGHIVGYTRDTR